MPKQLIRWSVALVGALGLFVGLTSPAGAAELPVSGSYSGTGQLTSRPEDCPNPPTAGIGHTIVATGTLTSLGDVEVDGVSCLDGNGGILGFVTFTGADGAVSTNMTGTITPLDPLGTYREDMTATVTGGTGDFEGATGTLTVVAGFALFGQVSGDVSGSITVPPKTPTSRDDCKNGGWQNFEDENGVPFKNQGDCIAWVNEHT